jgi:hypothetical protein
VQLANGGSRLQTSRLQDRVNVDLIDLDRFGALHLQRHSPILVNCTSFGCILPS